MSQRKQWHNGKDAKATEMSTACDVDRQVAGINPSAFTNGGGDHTSVVKCKDVTLPKVIASFTMTNGGKNSTGVNKSRSPLEDDTMWDQLSTRHTGLDVSIDNSSELSKPSCPTALRRSDNKNGFANSRVSATNVVSENIVSELVTGPKEGHQRPVEVTDVAKRQLQIERRIDHLLTRVRRVQILESNRMASQELIRFVDDRHKNLEQVAKHMQGVTAAVETLNAEVLQSEDIRSLSTAALVSLVQRLQTAHCSTTRALPSNSGSTLDSGEKVGVKAVSSVIYKNLRHLKRAVDPDATDSSSGGESDTDSVVVSSSKTCVESKPPSLRWSENRAAVACRWTWIQVQIAELEFQIRQCGDYLKRVRSVKETSLQPCTAERAGAGIGSCRKGFSAPSSCEIDASALGQRCTDVNRGLSISDKSDPCCKGDCPPCDEEDSAARCRPVGRSCSHPKIMRLPAPSLLLPDKERYHGWASCHCNGVVPRPCVLCSTFASPATSREFTHQSRKERLALLDHAYHAVLSFRRDSALSIKCEGVLHKEDWSRRSSANKNVKRTFKKKSPVASHEGGSPVEKKLKTTMSSLILPSKQHCFPTTSSRVCKATGRKKKRRALEVLAKRGRSNSSSHTHQAALSPLPSTDSTALTQSAPAAMLRDARGIIRRRGESPYDINNIVIPYTMAAATRVERLQYKEIMTPKWREVEANAAAKSSTTPEEEEVEDVSDEAVLARHVRLENQEKKRYTVFKTTARRSRQQSLRGDSDPSTPEPWSPDSNFIDTNSSLPQPPSAASPVACLPSDDGPQTDDSSTRPRCGSTSLQRCARSRSDINEDTQSISEEAVLPWPKRTFPLSDEDERLLQVGEVCGTSSTAGVIAKHPDGILAQAVVDQSLKWTVIPSESDIVEQEKAIVVKLARQ